MTVELPDEPHHYPKSIREYLGRIALCEDQRERLAAGSLNTHFNALHAACSFQL